jgi:ABC-2 type transport system ATP-binding protein
MPQIVVDNLSKSFRVAERNPGLRGAIGSLVRRRYRVVEAIRDVSFSLDRGELVGLIGPNGAGKSTTIKILSGILTPDGGRCEIDGRIPWRDRIAHVARIGVVFGQRTQLWWDLPAIDGFDLIRDIYRVPDADYRATRDEMIALLRLERILDQPVRQLSLGQRMRCEIAAAMLHRPSILFLDEPTIGLDAVSKLAVRDFVKTLNRERGVTVILTTHDMHDIEALARRVIVIGKGRILADQPFDELRTNVLRDRRAHVEFAREAPNLAIAGVKIINRLGNTIDLSFDPATIPVAQLIATLSAGYEVIDVHIEQPLIEEVIARFYDLHGATEA